MIDGKEAYLVSGQKVWTSRAEYSDLMLLLARSYKTERTKYHRTSRLRYLASDRGMNGMKRGRNVPMFDSFHVFHYIISLCFFQAVVIGADSSLYIERWKRFANSMDF